MLTHMNICLKCNYVFSENNLCKCGTCYGQKDAIANLEKITLLEQENKKLNNFCKEFVYMEDNPKEHELMHKKITLLEQKLKSFENTGMIGSPPAQFMEKIILLEQGNKNLVKQMGINGAAFNNEIVDLEIELKRAQEFINGVALLEHWINTSARASIAERKIDLTGGKHDN